MRALIDTDIWSEIFKGKSDTVLARAEAYLSQHGNVRHYSRIQDLGYPLVIQNWRDPAS